MTSETRVLVICGDMAKHLYFAAQVLKNIPNSKLVIERYPKDKAKNYVKEPCPVIKKHFDGVEETDSKYFDNFLEEHEGLLKERLLFEVEKGEINTEESYEKIKEYAPSMIALNATSIIKGKLLEDTSWKMINHHAGLCQYYRGSGNNVWPFLHDTLDKIGITIHYVDQGLDTGDIILQGRPEWANDDNTHTIGSKCAMLGADLTVKVISKFLAEGETPRYKQDLESGFLCKKKDFTKEVVLEIYKKIEDGVVRNYLEKTSKAPIYTW